MEWRVWGRSSRNGEGTNVNEAAQWRLVGSSMQLQAGVCVCVSDQIFFVLHVWVCVWMLTNVRRVGQHLDSYRIVIVNGYGAMNRGAPLR